MSFLPQMPQEVRKAALAGPREVVRVTKVIEDYDLCLLVLWHNYAIDNDVESGRVLAIEIEKIPNNPLSQACRLWLMTHGAEDLGIVHTLIGYLHKELVESRRWPGYLAGLVLDFLRTALKHAEVSVRAEVLSLLLRAISRELLNQIIHADAAVPLADALQMALGEFADEDELVDLASVDQFLRTHQFPPTPTLDARALQRLVLDIADSADRYASMIDGLSPLLTLVQRRALLNDAGVRVARTERPLQTLRVKAEETATRLVQALIGFAETVVGVLRNPDFSGMDAPDYGLQMAWAPAASVPIHLFFAENDARSVFEMLERIVLATRSRGQFDEAMATLQPAVVSAFLRLLQRMRQHEEQIEVILTDPQSVAWQRAIVINPGALHNEAMSSLLRQARSVAREQHVFVPKDQVPQANTVGQVFQAVDAMLLRGIVTFNDIDGINSDRQVNYYKQGARVLEFFDADNQPTSRARSIVGIDHKRRLALTAVYFEDSPIGRAWRSWAGKDHLSQVDPNTAQAFLEKCVPGLTGTTPGRRASTLRAWYSELVPTYLGGGANVK